MAMQLLKLLNDNRGKGFLKAEDTGEQATVYLYDVIVSDDYYGGVSALSFARELANIKAPIINLRINSPGGDVFAATAMESAMREHPSQIIAHIDGQAASAATHVALAADIVKMSDSGFFMIHQAWTLAMGNVDDMLRMAGLLEKADELLATTYLNKTGKDAQDIRDWMKQETWFNAQEAFDNGFVDEIVTAKVKASSTWNLSAYAHPPETRDLAPADPTINDNKIAYMQRMSALAKHL